MIGDRAPTGWGWFEEHESPQADPAETALCQAFARCFAGRDGQQVVDHLTRVILDRRLGPEASDAQLRHLEGQRGAIAYLLGMIERGGRLPLGS